MNYTSKQQVLDEYNLFINVLKRAKTDLQNIGGNDDDVKKIKNAVIKIVESEVDSALEFADKTLHNQNWDNLTIGFFGITNAGKSTIVETFRILYDNNRVKNNDGMIVGDGRHDFTTKYAEYKFFIDNTEFTLIDVPGIEGNENIVKDKIFEGLSKAHIIFYVHGHDAPPDEKIVQKIKNYIGKGVNVYSVFNIKGGTGNYDEPEERVTLLDDRKLKGASLVEETFRNALGDTYQGNICIQALLAMTAYATFNAERKDLIKKQNKLLSYFGNAENVLSFSHFKDLVDVVKGKAKNAKSEIIESNAKKLHQQIRQAYRSLSQVVTGTDDKFYEYIVNINIIFSGATDGIKNGCVKVINEKFSWFEDSVCDRIKNGGDNFDDLTNNLEDSIDVGFEKVITKEINALKEKIKEENKKFADLFFQISDFHTSFNFNVSGTDYDFGDFFFDAFSVFGYISAGFGIGSFFPGLGNIIGGIIGGIIGLLTTIFVGKEARIAKAQNQARTKISEVKAQVISTFKQKGMIGIKNELNEKRDELIGKINTAIKDLKTIKSTVEKIKQDLTNIVM